MAVVAIDSQTLFISWSPPQFEDQNGFIREYRIYLTEQETGAALISFSTDTDTSVHSLHPAYTYNCTVSAYTIGEGPRSEAILVTMPEDGK